jgi:hypothetical protein
LITNFETWKPDLKRFGWPQMFTTRGYDDSYLRYSRKSDGRAEPVKERFTEEEGA